MWRQMCFTNVIYSVLLTSIGFSSSQNAIQTTKTVLDAATEAASDNATEVVLDTATEAAAALPELYESDVICKECHCSEGVVDCSNLELQNFFEVKDWNGLASLGTIDVDLSRNFYVTVTQFPALAISKLNLSNCALEILQDESFSNLKSLSSLDLSGNKLTYTSIGRRVFFGTQEDGQKPMPFVNLRYLSLAYNDIHSLAQDVFAFMPYLTTLDLSGNPLAFIDQVTMAELTDLTKLKELRLAECDLETLPEGLLRRQRRLQRLDISGNRFASVPSVLSEAFYLEYLNFNKNPIQALTERTAISNLTNLQELRLCHHSKLQSIAAGALGGLEKLVRLHIRSNPRLTALDPAFLIWEDDMGEHRWPVLQELYLNNNNISAINSTMLEHWDQLANMDFSGNPYVCDCTNQWMVDVLVPLVKRTATNWTIAKMTCRRPYDYRGMTFAQLNEGSTDLECSEAVRISDVSRSEMAVLYGIMIGMLVTFPVVLVVVLLWKKGQFARCRRKMRSRKEYYDEEETDAF